MNAPETKIYKLNTGLYQVSYLNPLSGKRKRNKFYAEKDAKALREEVERQYISGNLAHFSEAYIGNLIDRHLKDCPESRFTERKNMFVSFCTEFNNTKLNALTRAHIKHWFQRVKSENDYSERTLNAIRVQLNYFFKYLEEENLIARNPLDKIRFRRYVSPRRPRVILAVDEVRQILTNAKTFSPTLLFPYLSCVAHTGARRKETVGLNREDIDFTTGLVHLKKTKNGRERFVRMSPILDGVMRDHLTSHSYQPVLNTDGSRLDREAGLSRLMDKFKAFFPIDNKPDWGSHSLRHSFAYNFLRKGGQMYQLQAILGHRSIDVTIDLYGQLQAQDIACPSPYEPLPGEPHARI